MALWVITYYWTRIWDSCQESKTENLCVLLILLEFWKLLFILRSADYLWNLYLFCSRLPFRFVIMRRYRMNVRWNLFVKSVDLFLSHKSPRHTWRKSPGPPGATDCDFRWLPRSASKIQYSWCQVSAIFAGDKIGSPRSANKITKCLTGPKEQRTK